MESLEELVAVHGQSLFRLALLLTGQHHAAEDLYQETMVRVHRKWSHVARAKVPSAYVKRMMVNAFTSGARARRSTEVISEAPAVVRDRSAHGTEIEIIDRDMLWRALKTLPPAERACLVLKYYEDLTDQAAAKVLGCRPSTVRANTSRALARLRKQVAEEGKALS